MIYSMPCTTNNIPNWDHTISCNTASHRCDHSRSHHLDVRRCRDLVGVPHDLQFLRRFVHPALGNGLKECVLLQSERINAFKGSSGRGAAAVAVGSRQHV